MYRLIIVIRTIWEVLNVRSFRNYEKYKFMLNLYIVILIIRSGYLLGILWYLKFFIQTSKRKKVIRLLIIQAIYLGFIILSSVLINPLTENVTTGLKKNKYQLSSMAIMFLIINLNFIRITNDFSKRCK